MAEELDVPLVDHFAHWTKQEQSGQNLDAWTTDSCHPNPAGHEELAGQTVPVIVELVAPEAKARTAETP